MVLQKDINEGWEKRKDVTEEETELEQRIGFGKLELKLYITAKRRQRRSFGALLIFILAI